MSRWSIKVEPYKEVCFEVLGKNTEWVQYARIKAFPGREFKLEDRPGSRVTVGFNVGDSVIHFSPFCKDDHGNVRESFIRSYNDPDKENTWTLYMEDGDGVDYDDLIVRVSVVDAKKERVQDFKESLGGMKYNNPSITND